MTPVSPPNPLGITIPDETPPWVRILIQSQQAQIDMIQRIVSDNSVSVRALNETVTRLGQLIEGLEMKQTQSCAALPTFADIVKVCVTNKDLIADKATRAVVVGRPELSDPAAAAADDKEFLKRLVEAIGSSEMRDLFNAGQITAHRHPDKKPEGKPNYRRILKVQFPSQDTRDSFISSVRRARYSTLETEVFAFIRRDLTTEELDQERRLRAEAHEYNIKQGMVCKVVRDCRLVTLSHPRAFVNDPAAISLSAPALATQGGSPEPPQQKKRKQAQAKPKPATVTFAKIPAARRAAPRRSTRKSGKKIIAAAPIAVSPAAGTSQQSQEAENAEELAADVSMSELQSPPEQSDAAAVPHIVA